MDGGIVEGAKADGGPPDGGAQDGGPVSGATSDAGTSDAGMPNGETPDAGTAGGTPATCYNRNVTAVNWDAAARGDGRYFASSAPGRLGFAALNKSMEIIAFTTDNATYRMQNAMANTTGAAQVVSFISDTPCDVTFAFNHALTASAEGSAAVFRFIVASEAKEAAMRNDSALSPDVAALLAANRVLRPQTTYFWHSVNSRLSPFSPFTNADLANDPDTCPPGGTFPGQDCYYKTFEGRVDFRLYDDTGEPFPYKLIPGYSP